jgi:hypothetical protein
MLLAVSANAADEWIGFADPVGNFTVEFQRQPRAMTKCPYKYLHGPERGQRHDGGGCTGD